MSGDSLKPRRTAPFDLATKVAALRAPHTYSEKPARIDTVETHMSCVFLTERHAYKLKKPVRYDFLDFSTLAARRRNCGAEVRLNRRLAADVYIGVVPLTVERDGAIRVDGKGETIDWLVKMRRLPADRMLDRVIRQDRLDPENVHELALLLAGFYRGSAPIRMSGQAYRHTLRESVQANCAELALPVYGLPGKQVQTVREAQFALLDHEPELFDARADEGRIVEGHGDLRPEHVCLEPKPVIFDCLEFNRAFRIVDAADELSSLAMECERLGAPMVGEELLSTYAQVTGDKAPERLTRFYKAGRACLRAKLAIWHTRELDKRDWSKWQELAIAYLRLAETHCAACAG